MLFFMTTPAMITLAVCESVVPSAAPAGPMANTPINKRSSPIFTAHAAATKCIGVFESPIPLKTELITLYAVIKGMPRKHILR